MAGCLTCTIVPSRVTSRDSRAPPGHAISRRTVRAAPNRPLTDNDKRGWKANKKLAQWYQASLQLTSIQTNLTNEGLAKVVVRYHLINDSAKMQLQYLIDGDGMVQVDYTLEANPALPNIPKIGMQMGIERSYDQIQWFGKGPLENYVDRRYGFDAGVYEKQLNDFMEPYVVPQENGNRTDIRWMYLYNKKSTNGLLVIADSLLSMSASPYTDQNVQTARHTYKLVDAGYINLNIDLVQMGVGGNDSWSDVAAPLDLYQNKSGNYQYRFYLLPIAYDKRF